MIDLTELRYAMAAGGALFILVAVFGAIVYTIWTKGDNEHLRIRS